MRKHKVLLYTHDGGGLGHLRRCCRIAEAMGSHFAPLVLTGMAEVANMVPLNAEALKLPSWDALRAWRAEKFLRPVWLDLPKEDALRMRVHLIQAVLEAWKPDAVLVDYVPFGTGGELRTLLMGGAFRKYLVLRGIIDKSDYWQLAGDATEKISMVYDRILVACDKNIVDVAAEYDFPPSAHDKLVYCGYVVPTVTSRDQVRAEMLRDTRMPWIVCSAGGGFRGEETVSIILEAARRRGDVFFDVVLGSRSRYKLTTGGAPENCRIHSFSDRLADWNASCDVSIINGGYNSLMEAISGSAQVIVVPNQSGDDTEQITHSTRLSRYHDIRVVAQTDLLNIITGYRPAGVRTTSGLLPIIDLNGASNIASILSSDLDSFS